MVGGDGIGERGVLSSFRRAALCAAMQYAQSFATETTTAIISRSAFVSPDGPFISSS